MSANQASTSSGGSITRLRHWWTSPSPLFATDDRRWSTQQLALIVGGLILLTVLPRALLALRLVSVCNDGYYYAWIAESFAGGEFEKPLAYLNVNVYPLILWGLKTAGLNPLEAGKWWGVLVSGLTVIPLFVLLRRLLDTRIAIAGCFLFAVHPELIEISVEPIREATFWLFFVSTLALLHKAADSRSGECPSVRSTSSQLDGRIDNPSYLRWRHAQPVAWSVAAGVMLALAVHTRTEGWALLAAVFIWMIWKPPAIATRQRRWARAGIVLAMIPLFLIVVNVTVLRGHDRFEWGRFTAVRNLAEWVAGVESRERVAPPPMATDAPAAKSRSLAGRVVLFVKESAEEFEYINLSLLLFGFLCLRSRLLSRELLPLAVIFSGQMLAVWVRLMQIGNINGRYFLTAYIMAIPTAACGGLYLLAALRRRCERRGHTSRRFQILATTAAGCLVALFWIDVLDTGHGSRRREVRLGERLRRELGPVQFVETDLLSTRAGYAVRGEFPYVEDYHVGDRSTRPIPEVIIIRATSQPRFNDRIREAGLVPLASLNGESGVASKYRVFVQPKTRLQTAAAARRRLQ